MQRHLSLNIEIRENWKISPSALTSSLPGDQNLWGGKVAVPEGLSKSYKYSLIPLERNEDARRPI
jgi:hypothetical protein